MLIVVPFARWENLDQVLSQWRAQTVAAPLALVTTYASTPTGEFAELVAEKQASAGFYLEATRPSIGAARNHGLELAKATGERWVLFLDDDDYFGPRLVETFADATREAPDDVDALSLGIRFVRFDDGLFLFNTPFLFCPGHCTAARVARVPKFKTIPRGEDNEWSHTLGMKHARQLGPWHFIYNRRGSHADGRHAARFRQEFGPCLNLGDKPDSYVDEEIPL